MQPRVLTLCLVLLLVATPFAWAETLDEAFLAAQSGNYTKARAIWTSEANQGDANAQYNLGVMYEHGHGVPQNYKEAVKFYRLAAEQRCAEALYNLGVMYTNGKGVPQDYKEAVKLYRLAAEQGYGDAQVNLGNRYANGQGVPQSYEDAYAWWVVAAANGHERARKCMEILQNKMTSSQVEKAQKLAKEIWARVNK